MCSAHKVSKSDRYLATSYPVLSVTAVSEIYNALRLFILVTILCIPSSPTLFPLISTIDRNFIWLAIREQLKAVILLFLIYSYLILLKVDMIGICLSISLSVMLRLFNSSVFKVWVILICFHSYIETGVICYGMNFLLVFELVLWHVFTESVDFDNLFCTLLKEPNFYIFKDLFNS